MELRYQVPSGCSKRPSSKAAASKEARRTLRYVEPLSDARTMLADFFSVLIGAVVVCLALTACSGDTSQELLETAEFEERELNVVHAKQLYEEIVRSHPSSPQAETARARLAALK